MGSLRLYVRDMGSLRLYFAFQTVLTFIAISRQLSQAVQGCGSGQLADGPGNEVVGLTLARLLRGNARMPRNQDGRRKPS